MIQYMIIIMLHCNHSTVMQFLHRYGHKKSNLYNNVVFVVKFIQST